MMQKFIYERIREAFTEYVPKGMIEKYQSFLEHYPAEQRRTLHTLYCAEVDNLILKMLRASDELCQAVFSNASDILQCLVVSRYAATLRFFMHTKDKALSNTFGPDEILAACLLTLWFNHLQDADLDELPD